MTRTGTDPGGRRPTHRRRRCASTSVACIDPASGGTSGIHFAAVLERLGIAREVAAQTGAALTPPDAKPVAVTCDAAHRVRVEDYVRRGLQIQ